MRRNISNTSYAIDCPEYGRNHVTYYNEPDILQYVDSYHTRNESLKIRYCMSLILIVIILISSVTAVCYVYKHFSDQNLTEISENEVCLMSGAESYQGENYLLVVQEMQAMGFTNITIITKKDLITGLITKPGTVSRISIGGNPDFVKNDIFAKDSAVIIEYHSK